MGPTFSRRHFLLAGLATAAGTALPAALTARDRHRRWLAWASHPEPRKGYTAEKVLKADQLDGDEDLIKLFDGVRKIPQIIDGIRCQCGCADQPEMYSLLSCYEGEHAMAKWCPICEGQGRLAVRMAGQGKTLDQIRKAIDIRY